MNHEMHPGKKVIMNLLNSAKKKHGTLIKIAHKIDMNCANLSLLKSKNANKPFIHVIFDRNRGLKYFRLLELLEPTTQDVEMMCEWSGGLMRNNTSLDVLELLTNPGIVEKYYSEKALFEIDYSFEEKISILKEIYKIYPEIMNYDTKGIISLMVSHKNIHKKIKKKKVKKEHESCVPQRRLRSWLEFS